MESTKWTWSFTNFSADTLTVDVVANAKAVDIY